MTIHRSLQKFPDTTFQVKTCSHTFYRCAVNIRIHLSACLQHSWGKCVKQEQTLSSCFFISSACLSQDSFRLSVSRRVSASTAPSLRSASAFSCAAQSLHSANCALRNTFSLWSSCNPCDDKGLTVLQEGNEKKLVLNCLWESSHFFLPTCRRSTHMSPYEAPRPRRAPWTCRSLSLRRCSNWAMCCFCLVDNQIHYQQKQH